MIGPRMTDRITVFHPTGVDVEGAQTGVTTENVPARVDYRNTLIRNQNGDQVVSRALVETGHPVVVGDLITLPGEITAQPAIDVRIIKGLGGKESHREVYL